MTELNETHEAGLKSWVESANERDCRFPIQNLPYAVYKPADGDDHRAGIAIGRQILDLRALASLQPFCGAAARALDACRGDSLNELMSLDAEHWSALRLALSRALRAGSAQRERLAPLLSEQATARFHLPAQIGDYTDF